MDDKGMLEKETALEHAKKIFNDAEELKLIEDYLHSCSHSLYLNPKLNNCVKNSSFVLTKIKSIIFFNNVLYKQKVIFLLSFLIE